MRATLSTLALVAGMNTVPAVLPPTTTAAPSPESSTAPPATAAPATNAPATTAPATADTLTDAPPPFPAPGRLVDLGGWRMHIDCAGKAKPGAPTVVLEAGAGDFSVEWSLVQPEVSKFARVCSYDRSDDGWSDWGPHPRTLHQDVYELHTLLDKAGECAPFVLVGHSYGGWIVRLYRSTYPKDVGGMVLIEGGLDNPLRQLPDGTIVHASDLATGKPIPPVKTSGPLRVSDIPPAALASMKAATVEMLPHANEPPRDLLPASARRMRVWATAQIKHYGIADNPVEPEELAQFAAERAASEHPFGDLPLVVMTRGIAEDMGPDNNAATEADRRRDFAALAALSTKGRLVVAERSGHHIHLQQPGLVVDTIRDVVNAARGRDHLPATGVPARTAFPVQATSAPAQATAAAQATAPAQTMGAVAAPDGVRIAYDAQGEGAPALVFVHGWSCDRSYWAAQVGPFSRRHKVVTIDLAGHGESGLDRREWTIAAFGDDVAAVVKRLDLKRVVLIGHSMGGDVVVEAARRLPGRVAGMVWVDVYKTLAKPRTPEEIRSFIAPFRADFVETTRSFVRGLFPATADQALVERVAADMSSEPPAIALAALESSFSHDREIPKALRDLHLPVVAINPDNRPTDLASMKRNGVEVVIMPGVGHFLMMEDPERFNGLLEAAIQQIDR